jgi:hypothetical protein
VRGLEPGAVLRIGEDARLTPLAADIVNEKKIEIVRRASRRGSKASKLIAVGATTVGSDEGRAQECCWLSWPQGAGLWRVLGRGVDYPDFAHASRARSLMGLGSGNRD